MAVGSERRLQKECDMNRLMMCGLLALVVIGGCGSSLQERRNLAVSNFQENRFEEAKSQFKQIVDRNPDDAASCYYLGLIAQSEGKLTDAIYYYQCALTADPSLDAARTMLARAQAQSPTGKELIFLPPLAEAPSD
jgi:tetratricopeptide (TPR) repeat protein